MPDQREKLAQRSWKQLLIIGKQERSRKYLVETEPQMKTKHGEKIGRHQHCERRLRWKRRPPECTKTRSWSIKKHEM